MDRVSGIMELPSNAVGMFQADLGSCMAATLESGGGGVETSQNWITKHPSRRDTPIVVLGFFELNRLEGDPSPSRDRPPSLRVWDPPYAGGGDLCPPCKGHFHHAT